jgi:hypothetical protein
MLVVLLAGVLMLRDRGPGTAGPAPTPSTTTPATGAPGTATPSVQPTTAGPTVAPMPAGYEDCSAELGRTGYCPTRPECWAGIISVFDLPSLGTRRSCSQTHVYQTFAAGPLTREIRRQSQLDKLKAVSRLCRRQVLEPMLDRDDRDTDWEVLALPPQEADGSDQMFRCLFGRGDRDEPVALTVP